MQNKTNWLALLVAVVAASGIGFFWYSIAFQDIWAAGNDIVMQSNDIGIKVVNGKEVVLDSAMPLLINEVALIIYAFVFNWLINKTGMIGWQNGALLGATIGFFVLMFHYTGNRFSATPTSLSIIDGSYAIVLLTTMSAIIGGWRKG
ncbi:MAG: DUF1761 domain-containing protein [Bacteroidota bacterium]